MAIQFKVGYVAEYNEFQCLVLVRPDKDLWAGGEFFTADEISGILNDAAATVEPDRYEFIGYTEEAAKALASDLKEVLT